VEGHRNGWLMALRAPSIPGKGAPMAPKQKAATAGMTLEEALADVSMRLDAPGLDGGARKRLLQRQAELGDLRDELVVRARRQAIEQEPVAARR
jgi:hypothetical protein